MGSIGRFKKGLCACMDTSSINGHWTDSEGRCPLNSCYICGCPQRGCKKGSRACSKQPLFLLLSEAEYQAGCTIHLTWWVLLLFYLRRAWCRLFVDSLWLSGQSLKTQANQTCLEKQNLFLKKRLLLWSVCHWLVGTGWLWVHKAKGTKEDTEVILPTFILSENSPFPDPESNLTPFRRTQTFRGAALWESAMLGC